MHLWYVFILIQIVTSLKSSHHGYIDYENQLALFRNFFENHPDVSIVEIDFVYTKGKFISSHDYSEDNIRLGSELEEWIMLVVSHNKTLWIDVKDTAWSVISDKFSSFDVDEFYDTLNDISTRIPNISKCILISCQYTNTYKRLISVKSEYTIIHDMPQDFSYLLHDLLPLSLIKSYIHTSILESLRSVEGIVCLDRIFFSNTKELECFITQLSQHDIVVYSYNLNTTDIPIVSGKDITIQYDYTLAA